MPIDEMYQLIEGPLPKSRYTYLLEKITRDLLMGKDFAFSKESGNDHITIDGIKHNWSDIINYANLAHIELSKKDFDLYAQYFPTVRVDELDPDKEVQYRKELYQHYYDTNQKLPEPEINYQEMQAINVYTGYTFYSKMNALLRGEFDLSQDKKIIKDIIIQSVMCSSGLRKIPETQIKEAYRGAKMLTSENLDNYIKTTQKQGVVALSGFVSTSIKTLDEKNAFLRKPVHFHFTNLKGMYIAPISQVPYDKEFLMLPTQIQLTDYKVENGKHCFEARLATDLGSVNTHSLDMTHNPHRLRPSQLSDATPFETLCEQLSNLSAKECKPILDKQKELINSSRDFARLMEILLPDQREIVFNVMMEDNKLTDMTKSILDLKNVLMFLSPQQCMRVCEIKMELIKIPTKFEHVREFLSQEQGDAVATVRQQYETRRILYAQMDEQVARFIMQASRFINETRNIAKFKPVSDNIQLLVDHLNSHWIPGAHEHPDLHTLKSDQIAILINNVESSMAQKSGMKNLPIFREIHMAIKLLKNVVAAVIEFERSLANFLLNPRHQQFPTFPQIGQSTQINISRAKEMKLGLSQLKAGIKSDLDIENASKNKLK